MSTEHIRPYPETDKNTDQEYCHEAFDFSIFHIVLPNANVSFKKQNITFQSEIFKNLEQST